MRAKVATGLLVRTELGDTYFCPESVGRDPAAMVSRISEGLRANLFVKCLDVYGGTHFVSATHIVEMFIGEHPVEGNDADTKE